MGDWGQQHEPPQLQQHAPIVQQTTEDQMAIMPSMSARMAINASIAIPAFAYNIVLDIWYGGQFQVHIELSFKEKRCEYA